jgi:hypothetical protein
VVAIADVEAFDKCYAISGAFLIALGFKLSRFGREVYISRKRLSDDRTNV